jgi:hypothetical protein
MDIRGNDLPAKGKQHGKAAAASNAPIAPSFLIGKTDRWHECWRTRI